MWSLDDFLLAAICHADDVVLAAASLSAAEVMVADVVEKLSVGSEKTHWTWYPKNEDSCFLVDGDGSEMEGSAGVLWESKVCLK